MESLCDSCKKIKLFLTDVDGVLTDAGMYYSEKGDELKKFSTLDGAGFMLLRLIGIKTGFITGEQTELVEHRARKLQVDFVFQNVKNKAQILDDLCQQTQLQKTEVAYMGDDINDIEIIQAAGVTGTVPNNFLPDNVAVDYTTSRAGGSGAVREFCEWLLKQRDEYHKALSIYRSSMSK
jgi:N-acylneuraminate cytidylyltransferase